MISEVPEAKLEKSEIDLAIENFLNEYKLTQTPIEVSFRALIPKLKKTDRYTHLIHTYPAKLLMHIPYFFLNNHVFSKPGDLVLDPFCGTGTVLLEAVLAGRNAIGADANPLARLIAKVKTATYSRALLEENLVFILALDKEEDLTSGFPDVVNINYWFSERGKRDLLLILNRIRLVDSLELQDFFLVCFSNLIKKVSYADPRVSVPVRLNAKRYKEGSANFKKVAKRLGELESIDIFLKFESICKENIIRFDNLLREYVALPHAEVISEDARNITSSLRDNTKLPDGSVDLIITSPPYAGAQKYIRSSSLNLGWLGLAGTNQLKEYDKLNIGRENYSKLDTEIKLTNIKSCDVLIEQVSKINVTRAQIISNYIIEMQHALNENIRLVKTEGYFILIVGNNKVCNLEFNTQEYLCEYIESRGMKLILKLIDDIKSYGLMTKRNKTADIISREYILIFKK